MDIISTFAYTVHYTSNLLEGSYFGQKFSGREGISLLVWVFCNRFVDHVVPHDYYDYFIFRIEIFEDLLQILAVFGVGMKTDSIVTRRVLTVFRRVLSNQDLWYLEHCVGNLLQQSTLIIAGHHGCPEIHYI